MPRNLPWDSISPNFLTDLYSTKETCLPDFKSVGVIVQKRDSGEFFPAKPVLRGSLLFIRNILTKFQVKRSDFLLTLHFRATRVLLATDHVILNISSSSDEDDTRASTPLCKLPQYTNERTLNPDEFYAHQLLYTADRQWHQGSNL
ncbi:hypothetical protein TNCV_2475571 [Trichonephila clavipes]|nr:hypothetical protein TNCV_2475571 [Trichonephila clavipes]